LYSLVGRQQLPILLNAAINDVAANQKMNNPGCTSTTRLSGLQQGGVNLALVLLLVLLLPPNLHGARPDALASASAAEPTQKKCPITYCIASACKQLASGSWSCSVCGFLRVPNTRKNECVCPAGKVPNEDNKCISKNAMQCVLMM
jgi:hypothetical protein